MSIQSPGPPSVLSESAERFPREVPPWQRTALLVGVVILTFPTLSIPYGTDLDTSWMIGLHEALDRGLVHGRDIGLTYGPMGHAFYPLSKGEVLTSSAFLLMAFYASWWASIAFVAAQIRRRTDVALCAAAILATGMSCQPHASCTANLPLLATTGFFAGAHMKRQPLWAIPGVVLTAAALLGKFNIGVACLGVLLAYLALGPFRVGMRRALVQGGLLLGLFAAALALLFRITNGPVSYLGEYLRTSWLMAAGYSTQMSSSDTPEGPWLALVGVLVLCLLAPLRDRRSWYDYAPAIFLLALPLFFSYKSAFVRCDAGHLFVNLSLLPALLCLLLPAIPAGKGQVLLRLVVAATAAAVVLTTPILIAPSRRPSVSQLLLAGPANLVRLLDRGSDQDSLSQSFEDFRRDQELPGGWLHRIGNAPVDVYPWDISLIAANRLNWFPRYVLQSYQAFHPTLDALWAEHYRGPRAPRFVLYRYQAIDGQHPCLVDPRTWLEIYRWYDLAAVDHLKDLLLLERRSAPRFGEPKLIESRTIDTGQELVLPQSGEGLWLLEADLELNPLGELESLLYKVTPPALRIDYVNGGVENRRLVWKNLAGGALVSDLPRNLEGISAALAGKRPDRVRSVKFLTSRRAGFNKKIPIRFYYIDYN